MIASTSFGRHGGPPDPAPPRRRTSSGMDPPFWTDYFLPERTWREGSSSSFKGEGFFGIETERVPMTLHRLLVGLVEFSRRNAVAVVVAGVLLAAFSAWFAAGHLGVNTDTDKMFSADLPWRQRADELNRDFPQFTDLLVFVIDAREPEEAEATAASLAAAIEADKAHFRSVRRPDASPFLRQEGLLFLDEKQLEDLLNKTIDAQPFLGQLATDPSARGLFASLALLGVGVEQGQADLTPFLPALKGFHQAMADAIAGHPHPLSWARLLGGTASELGGKYKFVLAQPKLDFGGLLPGAPRPTPPGK